MADLLSEYGPIAKREKKTVVVTYRLTPADAEALMGTSGQSEASLNAIARLAALERIDKHAKERETA